MWCGALHLTHPEDQQDLLHYIFKKDQEAMELKKQNKTAVSILDCFSQPGAYITQSATEPERHHWRQLTNHDFLKFKL